MVRKPKKGKSLAELYPLLAAEWHPNMNGNLTPYDVTSGVDIKVWWKCPKAADHVYDMDVYSKAKRGRGCPMCSGKRVVSSNCLASTHPELALEWHPTKNNTITPQTVTQGSQQKIWWICSFHEKHVWSAAINSRTNMKSGCPFCAGQAIDNTNCLANKHPKLSNEWHPTKNGNLTPYDVGGGLRKVWWQCPKEHDHEYEAALNHRISNKSGCPFCNGQKVTVSNSIVSTHPSIALEWHPTKNGNLKPVNYSIGSNKKVWWKCAKGIDHEWFGNRKQKGKAGGCPICRGLKVVPSISLSKNKPKLSKEWHPTKNAGLSPDNITLGSNKVIWWQCQKDNEHIWRSTIPNRIKGSNCPFCVLTPQSRQELSITFELMLFFDINPRGFKTKVNDKIMSIDIFIAELNLGIEFDGSYWHKGKKELDKLKTKKLKQDGFHIMRIREEPLKPITEIDVISKLPFNAKRVCNEILLHIIEFYTLSPNQIQLIKAYLNKRTPQNEEGLNDYIDMILDEKSKKKLKRTTTAPKPH